MIVQSCVSIGKGTRIHLVQSPHFTDEGTESLMFISNKNPEKPAGKNMWYLSVMRENDGKRTLMFIIFRRHSLLES